MTMSSPISGRSIVSSSTTIPFRFEQLGLQHLLAAEREQLPGEQRGALGRLADLVQVGAERRALVGLLERERRVAADRGQHVVEVVRDAAGEPADRLQLLALPQLLLELLLLGHVLGHRDHVRPACRPRRGRARPRGARPPCARPSSRSAPRAGRSPARRGRAPRTLGAVRRGRPDARGRRAAARGTRPRCSPAAPRASGSRPSIEPSTPTSIVAVGADSNIVRNRSSLSRSSATVESERCASASGAIRAGRSQGLNSANAPTATPSPASTNSIPSPVAEKRPLSRNVCPRPSRSMIASRMWLTATKTAAASRPGQGERRRRSPVPIGIRDDPGAERAERVVREVEALDVPGAGRSTPQRQVEGDDEPDDAAPAAGRARRRR